MYLSWGIVLSLLALERRQVRRHREGLYPYASVWCLTPKQSRQRQGSLKRREGKDFILGLLTFTCSLETEPPRSW